MIRHQAKGSKRAMDIDVVLSKTFTMSLRFESIYVLLFAVRTVTVPSAIPK